MTTRGWVVSGAVAVGLGTRATGVAPLRVDPATLVGARTSASTTILPANQ